MSDEIEEITVEPPKAELYAANIRVLCDLEVELLLRRQVAAQVNDWATVSHLLKEQSLVLCDIARAVDVMRGVGGGT